MYYVAVMIFLVPMFAFGTKYRSPQQQTVYSENKVYFVQLDPVSDKQSIFSANDSKTPLWSFKQQVGQGEYFISTNGSVVTYVAWKFCRKQDLKNPAVVIYYQDGHSQKYSYKQLSQPRKYKLGEVGPIGDFWRIWRDKAYVKKDKLFIETTGKPIQQMFLKNDPTWPKTVNQAVRQLYAEMKEDDLTKIQQTKKENLIQFHLSLGMYIRNEFGMWQGNYALVEATSKDHPDDAAMVIIENLWQVLQEVKKIEWNGQATIEKDGTIVIQIRSKDDRGEIAETLLRYPKNHKNYSHIKTEIWPLKQGQWKRIPLFSDIGFK